MYFQPYQHVDTLCGMIIMTYAGIQFDQAGPFSCCVCMFNVYILYVCVRVHMHVCAQACVFIVW